MSEQMSVKRLVGYRLISFREDQKPPVKLCSLTGTPKVPTKPLAPQSRGTFHGVSITYRSHRLLRALQNVQARETLFIGVAFLSAIVLNRLCSKFHLGVECISGEDGKSMSQSFCRQSSRVRHRSYSS